MVEGQRFVFHIGLPKTATTSLQYLVARDERFAHIALVPSRDAREAEDGGARCREELREVFEMRGNPKTRLPVASDSVISRRASALVALMGGQQAGGQQGVTLFSEEATTLSPATDVRANAAVLGAAARMLRSADPGCQILLVMGTRRPGELVDSATSFFVQYRRFGSSTRDLEGFLRANWSSDEPMCLRQGDILTLFAEAVEPDDIVLLPLELLQQDPDEYHARISRICRVDVADNPLSENVRNARPARDRNERLVMRFRFPWNILRSALEGLEAQIGPRVLRRLPEPITSWAGRSMHRARTYRSAPPLSGDFLSWLEEESGGQTGELVKRDPQLDWKGLGY